MLEDVLISFQNIVNTNEPVNFANTYFGLPLNSQGRMIRMSEGHGIFAVPRSQLLGMMQNHYTFISSSLLPATLRANVVTIDWFSSTVDLDQFNYTDSTIGKRTTIRVEPSRPVQVMLLPEGGQKKSMLKISEIVELSLYGLAFLIDRAYYKVSSFGIGKKVFVKYYLPVSEDGEEETVISYEGVVKNVVIGPKCRVGMQVFPDAGCQLALSRYISRRREEIVQQINQICSKDDPSRE